MDVFIYTNDITFVGVLFRYAQTVPGKHGKTQIEWNAVFFFEALSSVIGSFLSEKEKLFI